MIPLGERHLRLIVAEYVEHYHGERNHQGLDNRLIEPSGSGRHTVGAIKCRERLGGTLSVLSSRGRVIPAQSGSGTIPGKITPIVNVESQLNPAERDLGIVPIQNDADGELLFPIPRRLRHEPEPAWLIYKLEPAE